MAELYLDNDRVVLDLDDSEPRREVLFSVETADWCANGLDELGGKAAICLLPGNRDRAPSIEVDAIVSSGKAMVRLRFGWAARRYYLTSQCAIYLATWLRMAARKAEEMLTWAELRDPEVLVH